MKRPEELNESRGHIQIEERCTKEDLEEIMEDSIAKGKITSEGGEFECENFNINDLAFVKEYCKEFGWECNYRPNKFTDISVYSESIAEYTIHRFIIKPLNQ